MLPSAVFGFVEPFYFSKLPRRRVVSKLTVAYQQHSSGHGRSTVQFQREAAGPSAFDTGPLREKGKPEAVIPDVSQKTLAEMIGTTRPRVNSFMNRFTKLGFVE